MSSAATTPGAGRLRNMLMMLVVFGAVAAASQTGQTNGQSERSAKNPKKPPAFSASGVQGTTAPSGYSTGVSNEEAAAVSKGVDDLNHELLSGFVPDWHVEDCSRESELVKAAKADPKAFEANYALGVFYLQHGDLTRSVEYLESARRVEPANINDSRALALALLGTKRNPEAVNLLEGVTGRARQDPATFRLLALAYQLSGEQQKARETYQRMVAAAPGNVDNVFSSGIGLISVGAPDQAAELFTSATVAHPNQAKLWLGLGIAQDMAQRKVEAIQSLLRAIAIDPDYLPPYFFLAGLADASPERAAEIRKNLAELVVAHPTSAEAHYDYALALWRQRRIDPITASGNEIESQLKLALTNDPNMARAHYLLGVLYADSNDLLRAESELSQAVKLEPNNAEAHYRLAQAYKRTHDSQLADTEMHQFLALHGTEGVDEQVPEQELHRSGSDLVASIAIAMPCDRQP
jgi:Tfp pilus assembly protein PilF